MPLKTWTELMNDADTQVSGFEPLTPGIYDFVIENAAKVGETQKGNPKFTINPSVESGPRKNARIFHDFSVSDSQVAMKRHFFGALKAIGLGPEFFSSEPTGEQIAKALQGKRFKAEVFIETGTDGVQRPRLRNITPAEGSGPVGGPGVPSANQAPAPSGIPQPSAPALTPDPAPAAPAPQAAQNDDASNPWATAPAPPPVF